MKNFKSTFFYYMLSLLVVCSMYSCRKSDTGGAPVITRIRTVYQSTQTSQSVTAFDSTTNDGKIGTLYAIIGSNLNTVQKIYINGVSVYFNQAYASSTTLQFSVSSNVPFSSSSTSNTITLVNPSGQVSFPFIIDQPVPGITSLNQFAGNAGDVITITGSTFNGLSGVSFGTIPATVLTKSPTVITVKVPTGVTAARILVTTVATKGGGVGTGPTLPSGTSELTNNVTAIHQASAIFGFSTAVFEDQLENSWYDYGWSNSPVVDQTLVRRGTSSIKVSYSGGYDGFGFGVGTNVPATKNAAIKFSLYGGKGTGGKNIHVILNGNFNVSVQISLVEGVWTDYLIPIANFVDASNPLPTYINGIVMQEFSGNLSVFNIDDVGIVDIP